MNESIHPPHDLELESAYLQGLLALEHADMLESLNYVPVAAFYSPLSKIIYKTIKIILLSGMIPDFATVSTKVALETNRSVTEITEFLLFSHSEAYKYQLPSLGHYIKELFLKRLALGYSLQIQNLLKTNNNTCLKDISFISHKYDFAKQALFRTKQSFDEQIMLAVERINTLKEYISTTYKNINACIGGYTRKNISILAGKPSHNKTTYTLCELSDIVKFTGCKGLYISAEEPAEMLWRRIIAKELLIPLEDMRFKRKQVDFKTAMAALEPIYKDNFIIVDQVYDAENIAAIMKEVKPDIVVVDYVQRLNLGEETTRGIENAVKIFKNTAKAIDCHVKLLAQVDARSIDKREDKIPRVSDVMWSQFLHQESSEFAVIYWHYKHSLQEEDKKKVEIIFWKNRYGDSGSTTLRYSPKFGLFSD